MSAGELNLAAKVSLYEQKAQEALNEACTAKDPEAQRSWNEIAEGWFRLAEYTDALRNSS